MNEGQSRKVGFARFLFAENHRCKANSRDGLLGVGCAKAQVLVNRDSVGRGIYGNRAVRVLALHRFKQHSPVPLAVTVRLDEKSADVARLANRNCPDKTPVLKRAEPVKRSRALLVVKRLSERADALLAVLGRFKLPSSSQ